MSDIINAKHLRNKNGPSFIDHSHFTLHWTLVIRTKYWPFKNKTDQVLPKPDWYNKLMSAHFRDRFYQWQFCLCVLIILRMYVKGHVWVINLFKLFISICWFFEQWWEWKIFWTKGSWVKICKWKFLLKS